jgi:hypothetical protein
MQILSELSKIAAKASSGWNCHLNMNCTWLCGDCWLSAVSLTRLTRIHRTLPLDRGPGAEQALRLAGVSQ